MDPSREAALADVVQRSTTPARRLNVSLRSFHPDAFPPVARAQVASAKPRYALLNPNVTDGSTSVQWSGPCLRDYVSHDRRCVERQDNRRSSPIENHRCNRIVRFCSHALFTSDFVSIVQNLIMDVRDSYRPKLHYCVAPAQNGAPSISPGQGSIPKPHHRPDSTSCCRCTYVVATGPTSPDSRPGLRNHAHDKGARSAPASPISAQHNGERPTCKSPSSP